MPKFIVYATQTISTSREVEAEDELSAEEEAFAEGFPGLMFLDHTYPDEGEWECAGVDEVTAR